jgi:hypothetical protein
MKHDFERERERHEEYLKSLDTPEGMRKALAEGTSMLSQGEAKCRTCGTVIDLKTAFASATIKEITVYPWRNVTAIRVDRYKPANGFNFSVQCPKNDGNIDLGTYRKGLHLETEDHGDKWLKENPNAPAWGNTYMNNLLWAAWSFGDTFRKMKESGLNPDGSRIEGWEPSQR